MRILAPLLFILLLAYPALAVTAEHGPAPEVAPENDPTFVEMFEIRVTNDKQGLIEVSRDMGKTWDKIGTILHPTNKVNPKGYTAAKWAADSSIAATAVNAIHIRTSLNEKADRGIVFSLLPKDMFTPPANYNSFLSPDSSIYTDIPAGSGIFGGDFSPFVGDGVGIMRADGSLKKLPADYVPALGDVLVIRVERPALYPRAIEFENRFGGFIKITYPDGKTKIIGQVLKPVEGVGRFSGGQFAANGRIRANHSGVIDICLTYTGGIAGFQIIPADHAMSPEMTNARILTQWMVVSPVNAKDPSPEGTAPLFKYFLRPVYSRSDILADDWQSQVARRFLVECKIKGSTWRPLPVFNLKPYMEGPIVSWANDALKDITNIRILFPLYD